FMLKDAQVQLLVTEKQLLEGLPEHEAQMLCLDTSWEDLALESVENPAIRLSSDNLAYVIYTSGSTGQPKGVMIPHRGICNELCWRQESFPLDAADAVLQRTQFSFDASVWELFAPLAAGARLIMVQQESEQDSTQLLEVIAKRHITAIQVVPSFLRVLLEEKNIEMAGRSLKYVFCGGE